MQQAWVIKWLLTLIQENRLTDIIVLALATSEGTWGAMVEPSTYHPSYHWLLDRQMHGTKFTQMMFERLQYFLLGAGRQHVVDGCFLPSQQVGRSMQEQRIGLMMGILWVSAGQAACASVFWMD